MDFISLLLAARDGDHGASAEIFAIFKPVLVNMAKIDNRVDEDLFQELSVTVLLCVRKFPLAQFFSSTQTLK